MNYPWFRPFSSETLVYQTCFKIPDGYCFADVVHHIDLMQIDIHVIGPIAKIVKSPTVTKQRRKLTASNYKQLPAAIHLPCVSSDSYCFLSDLEARYGSSEYASTYSVVYSTEKAKQLSIQITSSWTHSVASSLELQGVSMLTRLRCHRSESFVLET